MQYIDCNINPITRVVSYPGATIVQRDTNVEVLRFHFSLDAEYELENDSIRIMVLKDGKTNGFNAENVRTETNDGGDEELVFEHTITTHETATSGQIAISVCGNQVSGNNITEAWHTLNMVFQVASAAHSESDEGEDTPETIASNAEKIAALQTLVDAITSGRPIPVNLKSKMTDTGAIYLYTGNETGERHNYWYYHDGTSWVPGSEYGGMTIDGELSSTSENAVQNKVVSAAVGEIREDVTELNERLSYLEDVTLKSQSSTVTPETYIATSNKRLRLNTLPFQSNIILGNLSLVANDVLINGTITVELTNFVNGSYTVYASKTVSMSGATTQGELVKVCNIGITTIGETYVFITTSLASRFRAASGISGAVITTSDDITSETFTTRNVTGYEVMYSLDYAITTAYLQTLTNKFNNLLVDVEIPDSVLFYNVGYYFNNVTAEMESAGGNAWVVSDYIPVGNGITVTGSTYSQYRPQIVEYDSTYNIVGQQKLGAIGSVTKTYTPDDGVAFVRLQSTLNTGNIASGTQKQYEPVPMVYHVEKDGSGDYTNLADCIKEATRRKDAVVYVGAGTWDILTELGADYLAHMSASQGGIVLKNRVHVICSSKAYIKCLYTGTDANVINYLSAFNAGPLGFTLENADIEVANVRYCVHDERNAETDHYDNYYLNCRMKNTNTTSGSRSQCIGGGLGYDGHIVIDGCTFENPLRENYGVVSYHNAHGTATDSRSLIEVKGCYFYGKNTFRAGCYGNTTAITQCLVHGNSMGAEPYMTQEDQSYTNVNMEIIAWQNEIRST